MMKTRGFTMIELIMTLTIVGLLSAIAVPKFRDMRRRAGATHIIGDFGVVRHAVLSFYVDSQYFPAESKAGQLPNNLTPYLPNGFQMAKPQWELDYDNIKTTTITGGGSKGKGKGNSTTTIAQTIALSFTTPDTLLGRTAMNFMGNTPSYSVGNKFTLIIAGV